MAAYDPTPVTAPPPPPTHSPIDLDLQTLSQWANGNFSAVLPTATANPPVVTATKPATGAAGSAHAGSLAVVLVASTALGLLGLL